MEKRERIAIVDILTLIATVLVVMGHHKFLRPTISWYPIYDSIIYSFHMGFFMTVSGFLVKYTFPSGCQWSNYVVKKVKKFMPPYFAVGLLAALVSFKSFDSFAHDILMLLVNPCKGPIQIIWYIYVLLMYYCLAPLVFRLSTRQRWWLLAISVIPAIFNPYMSNYFCMSIFFRLLPFFLLGAQLADNHEKIKGIPDWKIFLWSLPFLLFLVSCLVLQSNIMRGGWGKLITSTISLPMMYWLARQLKRSAKITKISTSFSPYVYPVYLLQMFFINGLWLVWQKIGLPLTDATAIAYIVFSVVFTIVGIVILVKIYRSLVGKLLKRKREVQ